MGTLWQPHPTQDQRTNPHPQGGLKLILGYVRLPQGHQQPPGRTPVLNASSNSTIPLAWITEPANGLPVNWQLSNKDLLRTEINDFLQTLWWKAKTFVCCKKKIHHKVKDNCCQSRVSIVWKNSDQQYLYKFIILFIVLKLCFGSEMVSIENRKIIWLKVESENLRGILNQIAKLSTGPLQN